MIQAALALQQPLVKFYDLLEDEQEARLNALAEDRRKKSAAYGPTELPAQDCGAAQPAALQWPADEIEARLRPNDTQRAALKVLQDANARAVEILTAECQPKTRSHYPLVVPAMNCFGMIWSVSTSARSSTAAAAGDLASSLIPAPARR